MLKTLVFLLATYLVVFGADSEPRLGFCGPLNGSVYIKEGDFLPSAGGNCTALQCVSPKEGETLPTVVSLGCAQDLVVPPCIMSPPDLSQTYPLCCPHLTCQIN